MKPIKLTIKGLNSFEQSQEIDFQKLTSRGLFGIFGPTGSGKSSILDAITIALYGAIAREGKNNLQNAVNVNGNSLAVCYEFEINTDVTSRYKVVREIQKTSQGAMKTAVARITKIHSEGEEVLCEKQKEVNEKIVDIIGLKYDDFVRTVVLPQGKFSEFLKLDGKERNIMLERLFSLEKYGEELTQKLKRKQALELEKRSLIEGELGAYREITLEGIKKEDEELQALERQSLEAEKEVGIASEKYNAILEIYKKQEALEEELSKKNKLDLENNLIIELNQKIAVGEKVNSIQTQILDFEQGVEQGLKVYEEHNVLKDKREHLEKTTQALELDYEKQSQLKEKELPRALEEKTKLEVIAIDYDKYLGLDQSLKYLNNEIDYNKELLKQKEHTFKILEMDLRLYNESVEKNQILLENNKVNQRERDLLTKGKLSLEKLAQRELNLIEDRETQRKEEEAILTLKSEFKQGTAIFENNKKTQEALEVKIANLKNALKTHKYLFEKKEEIEKITNEKIKQDSNKQELKVTLEEIENQTQIYGKTKAQLEELDKKLNLVKAKEKEKQTAKLIKGIRENLKGETCPVCGSQEYNLAAINQFTENSNTEIDLTDEIRILEEEIKELYKIETQVKLLLDQGEEKKEKIEKEILAQSFSLLSENDPEEMRKAFEEEVVANEQYQSEIEVLEIEIRKLKDISSDLEKQLEGNKGISLEKIQRIAFIKQKIEKIEKENLILGEEINQIVEQLGCEDLESYQALIDEKNQIYESCSNAIQDGNKKIKELNSQKEELIAIKSKTIQETAIMENKAEETLKQKTEIEGKLVKALGTIKSPRERLEELGAIIETIEVNYEKSKKDYQIALNSFREVDSEFQHMDGKLKELIENVNNQRTKLISGLKEKNLWKYEVLDEKEEKIAIKKEISNLKALIIPLNILEEYRAKVENYKTEYDKTLGVIENLKSQLKEERVTEEALKIQKSQLDELALINKNLQDSYIGLKVKLEEKKEKYKRMEELFDKQKVVGETLARLSDLQDLFKGKKFVEFIAVQQMKYVSLEATKRLEEITSGAYSVETNDNGSFLIRDNKNGGVLREPSTLSGGETFVVSLALALALSAHIQLKGKAPLELFFLDEGFGTLDDNLLDTVISSLERIHHDKLKIGLISHVEQIKQRIPVKLMVEPSKSGLGGSKVKIEFS